VIAATIPSLASLVASLLVLAALFVLLRRGTSAWLIVAIVAELGGLAFRSVVMLAPAVAQSMPMLYSVWTLTALAFGVGLLGYAIEATRPK
jgi:hypothetical protein